MQVVNKYMKRCSIPVVVCVQVMKQGGGWTEVSVMSQYPRKANRNLSQSQHTQIQENETEEQLITKELTRLPQIKQPPKV